MLGRLFGPRPAAPFRAQIQHSRFKITDSGRGLRSACASGLADASSGPSRGEAAARSVLTDRFPHRAMHSASCGRPIPSASNHGAIPQPSGGACDEQREDATLRPGAAAGCRLLRNRTGRKHPPRQLLRPATPFGRKFTVAPSAGLPLPAAGQYRYRIHFHSSLKLGFLPYMKMPTR